MAVARRERWNAFLAWPQVLHAQCLLKAGRRDEAGEQAEHAFALACELGDPCWEGMAARLYELSARSDLPEFLAWALVFKAESGDRAKIPLARSAADGIDNPDLEARVRALPGR